MFKQLFIVLGITAFPAFGLCERVFKSGNDFCTVPIGLRNIFLKWPLVFNQNGMLYPVQNDDVTGDILIKVNNGERVTFSCGPNFFKHQYRLEVVSALCDGASGSFVVNGSKKQASELTCDLRVVEDVLDDVYGCVEPKLTASRFGYIDPNKNQTILLGEVCYNMTAGKTRFVHFKLGDETSSNVDVLPKNYLTSKPHSDEHYKIEIFRGLNFDKIYERIRSGTQTRQAPDLKVNKLFDEILLSSLQFQAVMKLGWNYYLGYEENRTLENLKQDIRRLCKISNCDIYAGTSGVKHLVGENGVTMEVYLHDKSKRFPLPRLLWFVINQSENLIAFAVANGSNSSNDFKDNIGDVCKANDCSIVTWLSQELKYDKNLICCNVNDLRHTIKEIPIFPDDK